MWVRGRRRAGGEGGGGYWPLCCLHRARVVYGFRACLHYHLTFDSIDIMRRNLVKHVKNIAGNPPPRRSQMARQIVYELENDCKSLSIRLVRHFASIEAISKMLYNVFIMQNCKMQTTIAVSVELCTLKAIKMCAFERERVCVYFSRMIWIWCGKSKESHNHKTSKLAKSHNSSKHTSKLHASNRRSRLLWDAMEHNVWLLRATFCGATCVSGWMRAVRGELEENDKNEGVLESHAGLNESRRKARGSKWEFIQRQRCEWEPAI